MKPLIIGQAPSADGTGNFEGRSGARLQELCGITRAEFLERFERINLFQVFPGKSAGQRGDLFPMREAMIAARGLLYSARLDDRLTVFVGQRVAAAFGMGGIEPFMWHRIPYGEVAVSPHPSGQNRWWNEPRNIESAKRFWRALAEGARA